MEKHMVYFNLLDALKEGCPICFLVKKGAHKFMDDFLYEGISDLATKEQIKVSRGFCNRHAWQLRAFGDGFAHAIVYENLAGMVLKEMEWVESSVSIKKIIAAIDPEKSARNVCLFCKQKKDIEARYVLEFWESFDDQEFSGYYKKSFGLCLPHLVFALKKCGNAKLSKELIAVELPKFSALSGELKEFIRKHDYRFSKEKFGVERDSWLRAIEKFIGKEGI